jgi:hypothetical protein
MLCYRWLQNCWLQNMLVLLWLCWACACDVVGGVLLAVGGVLLAVVDADSQVWSVTRCVSLCYLSSGSCVTCEFEGWFGAAGWDWGLAVGDVLLALVTVIAPPPPVLLLLLAGAH